MPLIQGGPPEWIWERTADPLRWEVIPAKTQDVEDVVELRLQCGLGIMRLQFFSAAELQQLLRVLEEHLHAAVEKHE